MILSFVLSIAFAQEPQSRAEELFFIGQRLFEEQDYNAAIVSWEEGYRLTNLPEFKKNIALAYEAMGEYGQAIQHLSEYRALASLKEQDALKSWMDELKQKQKEAEIEALERQEEEQRLREEQQREEARLAQESKEKELQLSSQPVEIPTTADTRTSKWIGITGWSVSGVSLGVSGYFFYQYQQQHQSLLKYCNDITGLCLENTEIEGLLSQQDLSRQNSYLFLGLGLAATGFSIWNNTKAVSITPDSINWTISW